MNDMLNRVLLKKYLDEIVYVIHFFEDIKGTGGTPSPPLF